jgi:hypothetical protein
VIKLQDELCYQPLKICQEYDLVLQSLYENNLSNYFINYDDNNYDEKVHLINHLRSQMFINNYERYKHNIKIFDQNINYLTLMIDSGATISLSNHKIADKFGLPIFKYKNPITLKFANGENELCTEFSYFGDLIGKVALIDKCHTTLLSSIQLSKRKIKVSTEYKSIIIKDDEDNIMHIHTYDYHSGPPLIPIIDLLNININLYKFDIKQINKQSNHLVASNLSSLRRKNIPITFEEFQKVIELHERFSHVDPGIMSQAIQSGAWPNIKISPNHIIKVFQHHHCEACALAKRNNLPIQNGSGVHPLVIGQEISVDRVPLPIGVYGEHTGIYVFVDRCTGYLYGILDKHHNLEDATEMMILHFKKYGFTVSKIRTDTGPMEVSKDYEKFLSEKEIIIANTGVEAQYRNTVERYIQQLKKISSTLMYSQSSLSSAFVGFAILNAIQIHNCTPNNLSSPETPLYHLSGHHPNMLERFPFPFGTVVSIKRTGVKGSSFIKTKNEKGYIIGFTEQNNGSTLVYIPTRPGNKKIFSRINVQPIITSILKNPIQNDEIEIEINDNEVTSSSNYKSSATVIMENIDNSSHDIDKITDQIVQIDKSQEMEIEDTTSSSEFLETNNNGRTRYDRSVKRPIGSWSSKPTMSFLVINGITQVNNDTPTLYQAMKSVECEDWKRAINIELDTLKELQTYEEVDRNSLPKSTKIIPTKFVLKIKRDANGEIIKKKARLVVMGNLDHS